MANGGTPILDQGMQWWCGKNATRALFGTGPTSAPSATDAIIHEAIDLGMYPSPAHYAIGDKTGFQSFRKDIAGPFDPLAIKLTMAARPAGTAATAPKYGPLLEAAGFAESGGTFVPSMLTDASAWLWGANKDGSVGHCFTGIAVQQVDFKAGDGHARLELAMQAAMGSVVYKTTLAANSSLGATTIQLAPGHGWSINGAPAWVQIGSETLKVISLNGDVATLSAAATATHSSGDAVTPMFFARTESDSDPVAEQDIYFDLNAGSEEIVVTKFGVSIKTGRELRAKESNSRYRRGVIATRPTDRVTISADLVYDLDAVKLHGYVQGLTSKAFRARIGPSASRNIRIDCPILQLKPFSAPEGAEGARMATITGKAYATDGNDISIAYL